jgi:hypothetical protein
MVELSPRRLTMLMNDHEDAFQGYGQSERREMRAIERKRRENIIKKSKKMFMLL